MTALLAKIAALLASQKIAEDHVNKLWLDFGVAVREARKEMKIPLIELARRVRTSKSDLSYRENGERAWDMEMARKVMEALKE